jgi:hypothetical protein
MHGIWLRIVDVETVLRARSHADGPPARAAALPRTPYCPEEF